MPSKGVSLMSRREINLRGQGGPMASEQRVKAEGLIHHRTGVGHPNQASPALQVWKEN